MYIYMYIYIILNNNNDDNNHMTLICIQNKYPVVVYKYKLKNNSTHSSSTHISLYTTSFTYCTKTRKKWEGIAHCTYIFIWIFFSNFKCAVIDSVNPERNCNLNINKTRIKLNRLVGKIWNAKTSQLVKVNSTHLFPFHRYFWLCLEIFYV